MCHTGFKCKSSQQCNYFLLATLESQYTYIIPMGKIYNFPKQPQSGLKGNNKARLAKSTPEGRIQAKQAQQKTATANRMMPLMFTTVLHKGFSEVSVNFIFKASSSSLVSFGPFSWSSPQNRSYAFLKHPFSFWGASVSTKRHPKIIGYKVSSSGSQLS